MKKSFSSKVENIRLTCLETAHLLQDWLVPQSAAEDILLSIDEALTNIQMHGYTKSVNHKGPIFIEIMRNSSRITVIIKDFGKRYSLENIRSPDTNTYLDSNIIGGFGVSIIRKLMNSVKLIRINNQNILSMYKEYSSAIHEAGTIPSKNIITKTADASIENGILKVITKPGSCITLKDAEEQIEAYKQLIQRHPDMKAFAMLINTKGIKMISKDARNYYTCQPQMGIEAIAIVIDSVFSHWIANMFISLNKRDQEIKMFNSEYNARQWLNSFKNNSIFDSSSLAV